MPLGRPPKDNALTAAEISARYRKSIAAKGGRQLSAVQLGPDDAAMLDAYKARRGIKTDAEAIRDMIRKASP